MKCPEQNVLDLASMGLADRAAMDGHARGCGECRERLAEAGRVHTELSRAHAAFRADHERLREEMLDRLPEESAVVARVPAARPRWRLPALGAAAALVLAVIGVVFSGGGGVALADVVAALREVQSVEVSSSAVRFKGGVESGRSSSRIVAVEGVGERTDTLDKNGLLFLSEFVLPAQGRWVTVFHSSQEWAQRAMTPDEQASMTTEVSPEVWLIRLLGLTQEGEPRRLGRSQLNDRVVEGFELPWNAFPQAASSGTLRMWVDVQALLPARMECETVWTSGERLLQVYEDFRWDATVGAGALEVVVPAGFRERPRP